MRPKLSFSLTAALALSVAAGRAAHAAPRESSSSNAQIDAAGRGNPHSVDNPNRTISSHSPTNDEINGAETGNPQSPDYLHRPVLSPDENTNIDWQSSEAADPNSI